MKGLEVDLVVKFGKVIAGKSIHHSLSKWAIPWGYLLAKINDISTTDQWQRYLDADRIAMAQNTFQSNLCDASKIHFCSVNIWMRAYNINQTRNNSKELL